MFTIVSEIYRMSNYLVPTNYLYGEIEYKLFLVFHRFLRLPLSSLLMLRNLGIVIYLTAIMLFVFSFSKTVKNENQSVKPVGHIITRILLIAHPINYFCFYHPETAYRIYLLQHSLQKTATQELLFHVITAIDFIMVCLTFVYLFYPIGFLIHNYMKNQITFFAEQLLGLAISLGLLNSLFFMVFFVGTFKSSVMEVFHSAFWRYQKVFIVPTYYVMILPLLFLIILLIIHFIIIRFKTDNLINGLKERAIRKNLGLLNTNLKDVLHSNKNVMFNIKILAEESIQNYGTRDTVETLNKILTISQNHINATSKALDNIRELKVRTLKHNFIDAIEVSLSEVSIPDTIEITKHYHCSSVNCDFDMYHMSQAISNLLTNAVDAIGCQERTKAHIDLTVDVSKDWIYFSVRDNGCGIPKKMLKKIFSPYFSTKSKQNNWGIGLSYVFRVITSHYGHIKIRSKLDEYTMVEILLPRNI
ncbi:MAG: ATP-binding protein [Acetanaerobacterium sp.]